MRCSSERRRSPGPSVQAIVARVMTEAPRSLTSQRKSIPQNVNAAVLKALDKLPADRFSSAAEFSKALVTSDYGVTTQPSAAVVAPPSAPKSSIRWVIPWAIAGIATVAAVTFAYRSFSHQPTTPIHLAVDLPSNFKFIPTETETLGISADGSTITFVADVDGKAQMMMRRLDSDSLITVKGSTNTQGSAEISPDGKWLAFGTDRKMWKVPVAGGTPTPLTEAGWAQITWVGNGELVYTKNYDTGMYRISSDGGDPKPLTTPDRRKGELGHWWPQLLPDGDHVLFTNYTTPADKSTLEVISLKTGKRQVVFRGGWYGRYVAGHLLFTRDVAVMVIPFDVSALKVTGTAVPLPIEIASHASNGWAAFAVSPTGTLVYLEDALKNVEVVWSDENGNEESALDSAGRITSVAASPDNRKIALVRDGDVWIYDRDRGVYTRLTNSEQVETSLVWTPDSREILYSRDVPQYDIFKRAVDAGTPEQLVATSPSDKHATAITPDGRNVIFNQDQPGGADDFIAPLDPADKTPAKLLVGGTGNQGNLTFSPDGRWITFESLESGRAEVYVAAYPIGRGPARQQVSPSGGDGPSWSKDGRAIYYTWGDKFWRAKFDSQTGAIGKPEMLTKLRPSYNWSIGPDGRFLLGKIARGGSDH
jgi:Periplasmic component of the Tol biopolymer transport system